MRGAALLEQLRCSGSDADKRVDQRSHFGYLCFHVHELMTECAL